MIRAPETPLLDYKAEWAMNADRADELRPDGRNPCNGDETIAITTATYITGLGHLTQTTAPTRRRGRTIGLWRSNNTSYSTYHQHEPNLPTSHKPRWEAVGRWKTQTL